MMYWKLKAVVNIGDIYVSVNMGEIDTVLLTSRLARENVDKVFGFRPLGLCEQFIHWLDLYMSLDNHDF